MTWLVAKIHTAEPDFSPGARKGQGLWGIRRLFFFIQELEDPFRRGHGGLENIGDAGQLSDGHAELTGVLQKGLDMAYRERSLGGKQSTGYGNHHIAQVAHKADQGHDGTRDKLRLPVLPIEFIVHLDEGRGHFLFQTIGLDDAVPGKRFLHMAVELTEDPLVPYEILLGTAGNEHAEPRTEGQHAHGEQGEYGADAEHHSGNPHYGYQGSQNLNHALLEALADHIHVIGDAA